VDEYEPQVLGFIALCNGVAGARSEMYVHPGQMTRIQLWPHYSAFWLNAATIVQLDLVDVNFLAPDMLVGYASLQLDHMLVGDRSPWCAYVGKAWPQAPVGLLHWTRQLWTPKEHGLPQFPEIAKFSLLTEKV
jgi:hypothetical protein